MGRPPQTRFSPWKLKTIRATRGFSQLALGEASDMDQSQVGRYELGMVVPRLVAMQKMAFALGVPMVDLQEER